MAVHGSDESKPLACSECGKRFLSNSALACHLKVHATEMFSYDCPICSQPFDQIHALKEHVHIHRINNVYTCPHCMKVCTYVFYAHRYNYTLQKSDDLALKEMTYCRGFKICHENPHDEVFFHFPFHATRGKK